MGSKGSTTTNTTTIPQDVLNRYNSVNDTASSVAQTPFQTYSGEFVAPINAQQQAGITATNNAANMAQPYYGASSALTNASVGASSPLTSSQINQYLSPYLNDVAASTMALNNQQYQQAQSGQLGTAIQSGAFGGDRAGVAAANLQQQQSLANNSEISGLLNTGYNTALSTAQQQQAQQVSALQNAATGYSNLGTAAQTSALQGASAQLAAGTTEQTTQQAQDTALYNQFLQQQSYPFQVAQFLANIAEGTGSLSGSTTTSNTSSNGIFSDERLKQDIRPVGETYDGQQIYTYKYKGSPQTHMGLMAQEVEKDHPEAVGLAGGYKTVDYDKATRGAGSRDPESNGYASGGLARAGYADGGTPYSQIGYTPQSANQMLAAYQAMYAPAQSGASSATAGLGGGSRVPAPMSGNYQLHPPQAQQPQQSSQSSGLLHEAGQAASAAQDIKKAYDTFKPKGGGDDSDGGLGDASLPSDALGGGDPFDDYINDSDVNGGLAGDLGFAVGGSVGGEDPANPYDAQGLDIPDTNQHYTLNAPNAPKSGSGDGGLLGAAKDIASIVGLFADGGRTERASGGAASEQGKEDTGLDDLRASLSKAINDIYAHDNAKAHELASPEDSGDDQGVDTHDAPEGLGAALALGAAPGAAPDSGPAGLAPMPRAEEGIPSIAALISKAEGTGKNPKSSAVGPFQFLNDTFRHYAGKVDPELAKAISGMSNSELSAFRKGNPQADAASRKMGELYIADNSSALKKAGFQPSASNVYLAHLLGTQGALNVLRANPETPLIEMEHNGALTKGTTAANPIGKTAGDVIAWAGRRMAKMADNRSRFADGGLAGDDDAISDDFGAPDDYVNYDDSGAPVSPAPQDILPEGYDAPAEKAGLAGAAKKAATAAPSASAPEQSDDTNFFAPEGLARYIKETPDYYGNGEAYTDKSLKENLKHGKTDVILPILKGLAAFGTAPTKNFFYALASGLGAGADSYQQQRQFEKERTQTAQELALKGRQTGLAGYQAGLQGAMLPYQQAEAGANIGAINAGTRRTLALTPAEVAEKQAHAALTGEQAKAVPATYLDTRYIPGSGMVTINKSNPQKSFKSNVPGVTDAPTGTVGPDGAPANASGAPGAPTAQPRGSWRPVTNPDKVEVPQSYYMMSPELLAQQRSHDLSTSAEQEKIATAASDQQMQLSRLNGQYGNLPSSGFLAPGYGGQARNDIVREVNAFAHVFGIPDVGNTSSGENLAQLTSTLGMGLSHAMGQRGAGGVIKMAIAANPGIENSPMAFKRLTSGMWQEAQREKDRAEFYKNWQVKAGGTLVGAREAFDKVNPPKAYAIRAIMSTVDPADVSFLKQHAKDSGVRQAIDNKYGNGVASYFVGR